MLRFCSSKIPSKNPTPDSALWPMSQEKKPSPFLERPEGEKTAFSPLKFADFFLPMHRTDSSCPSVSVSFFLWFQKKNLRPNRFFFGAGFWFCQGTGAFLKDGLFIIGIILPRHLGWETDDPGMKMGDLRAWSETWNAPWCVTNRSLDFVDLTHFLQISTSLNFRFRI